MNQDRNRNHDMLDLQSNMEKAERSRERCEQEQLPERGQSRQER